MPSTPLALLPALPSELLAFILDHHSPSYPTTLIICLPRASFLSSLIDCLPPDFRPPRTLDDDDTLSLHDPPYRRHPLLVPTLHQIRTSRTINLVFTPSVSHLRAYLATFPLISDNAPPAAQEYDKRGKNSAKLVVYGLIALHKDTSEWSAQGLGHTLAALVETGHQAKRSVIIVEEKERTQDSEEFCVDEEISELELREERRRSILKVWTTEVPVLSGGKMSGVEGGWSGRVVEVGRIVGRWFRFAKGEWNE